MYNSWGGFNYFQVSDGTKNTYRYWDINWSDGNWHYLTAVINRNTNKLDVYLDGTLHNGAGTGNITGFGSITTTSSFRMYGGTNGRHDELSISTIIRNASWIKTCYNNQNNPASFYSLGSQEQVPSGNQPPIVFDENPADNSVNENINITSISVMIQDPEGKHINWTITTSPNIGSGSGANGYNGTKTCAIAGLAYSTIYTWIVKANDGSKWTNKTYSFTTQSAPVNNPPIVTNPNPANMSTGVPITLSLLTVLVQDPEGKHINWTITTTPNIGSSAGTNEYNGTKTCAIAGLTYSTMYNWTVKVNDGSKWKNTTYSFAIKQPPSSWWNIDWIYRKEINIDHTKVDANLRNFPVLINITSDTNLSTHTQPDGDDIVFTDAQGIKLNHEIELYTSATGRLVAWVNVSNLSFTTDTHLYLYYGNSFCSSQQNPQGTWNAEYLMVHHMNETGNIIDSTSHDYTGTNYGTTAEPNGKIDGCRYFDSTSDRYDFGTVSSLNPGLSSWTISLWAKISYLNNANILQKWGSNTGFFLKMYNNNAGGYNYFYLSDGTRNTYRYWDASGTDGNWHYLTIVINRNTNTLDVYLDGVLHNGYSVGSLANLGSITTTSSFRMYGGTNARHDEFIVSTTIRNSSWIKTSYNNQNNPASFYDFGSEELSSINQAPILSNEIPQNGSKNVSIYQGNVSIIIEDPEDDPFDWTIQGKYIINTGHSSDTAGVKTANLNTPLPPNTDIVWYVNVTDPSGSGNWTKAIYKFTTKGIIPTLKWMKLMGVGNASAVGPIIADVNNDGKMEVVRSGENGIIVYDGATGDIIWTRPQKMWNDHCPMEVIDLNKDSIPEIICSYENGTMTIHGNNGSIYWYNPDAPLMNKYPVAGDINADGYPEVYVCTYSKITALTHDGQIFATNWTYYPCFGGLSLGDTNYDGVFELYQNDRSYNYYPNCGGLGVKAYWASNLTLRWTYKTFLSSSHCPTLVDTNKDGRLEVVSLEQGYGGIGVFNATNGNPIHVQTNIPGLKCHSQPTIYDVDGDGNLELIACRDWSKPIIWDLYKWKQDAVLPYDCFEPPAVADIDGDGKVEILASTRNNITIFKYNNQTNKYNEIGIIPVDNPGYYGMAFIVAQDVDNDGLTELAFNRGQKLYVYDTLGASPTPRALSQFNFYSQLRGRSPYYVPYGPLIPIVKNENPISGAINQKRNPTLSIYIYDYQYDTMNITFKTNASTGIWHTIKTIGNIQYGNYTANPTEMNIPNKIYWWSVTVVDSTGKSTTKIYKFKTANRYIFSNQAPANGTINVDINPVLSIHVEDFYGAPINIYFKTNASGNWQVIGSNISVYNGTYRQKPTNMNQFNTTFYWRVCCTNGTFWTNQTYHFKIYNPPPTPWWNQQWMYRKEIKIDHTKVLTNLKNFPVLINLTSDTDLAAYVQPDGDDIVFTDAQGIKLNHEIELYTSATGRLVAWVNVTSLSSSTDTRFYLYYGNSLCSSQQNQHGTWNANYLMVQHMNETGNIYDSTSYGYTGTNYGTTTESNGKIDGCRFFDSTFDYYDFGTATPLNPGLTSWTISLWTKISYLNNANILQKWGSGAGFYIKMYNGSSGYNYFQVSDGVKNTYHYWNTSSWSDGNWHYLTAVINRNTNKLDVYLDGTLHNGGGTGNIAGFGSITTTSSLRLYGGTNGRHDEFTISMTVRNASWIKTSYNNQNNPASFYQIYSEQTHTPILPVVTNPEPTDGAMNIPLHPLLHITVSHGYGYLMNIFWETNASGTWIVVGTNTSVINGTYTCNTPWINTYYKKYWWRVEVNEGYGHWNNNTYSFTTMNEPNQPPTQDAPLLISEFGGDTTNENLICSNQSTNDPNGDEVYNTYHWLKNGSSLTNLLLSFNTQNSTKVRDYSGYHNNGTITGATWVPEGIIGGAYDFFGIDNHDYITIPDNPTLDGNGSWTEMTIECWVKSQENNQSGTSILGKWIDNGPSSYQIGFSSEGNSQLFAAVQTENGILKTPYDAITPLLTGTWYYITVTYKNGILKLYVNGSLISMQSNSGGVINDSTVPLRIGCYDISDVGVGGFFSGSIDEIKIFPSALSPEQINQHYLQSKEGFSTSSTIVAEETNIGDIWQCEIIPSDGQLDGLTKTSNPLTIINP
jgi:predicted double-glycine peptidase